MAKQMAKQTLRPVLDADLVVGHLWMGSYPPREADMFDVIVFLADDCPPELEGYGEAHTMWIPFDDDALSTTDLNAAKYAARRVRGMLELGKNVLVTCHKGRNRSGLVTAMTLMLSGRNHPGGFSAKDAIQLVRDARPNALSNNHFVQFLMWGYDAGRPLSV